MTAANRDSARSRARGSRRRYHLSTAGIMYVGVCLFLLLGAVNSQNNLLFAALGLGLAGLIVSGIVSGSTLMGIEVRRIDVGEAIVGSPLTIRYAVRNRNPLLPAFGLTIEESPTSLPPARAFVAHVGPGQCVVCEGVTWPTRRGEARLDAIRTSTTFPFGIARKSVTTSQPHTLLTLPLTGRVKPGVVRGGESHSLESTRPQSRVGADGEVYGVREYIPGDVPRHIAWRATARTGRLIVTQRVVPQPVRLWVAVRLAGDGRTRMRDEWAICIAASLIRRALREGVGVGLAVPAAGVVRPPRTGRWHAMRLLADLARLDVSETLSDDPPLRLGSIVSASVIAVHAGGVDRSWGPPATRHIPAESVTSIVDDDAFDAYLVPRAANVTQGAFMTRLTRAPRAIAAALAFHRKMRPTPEQGHRLRKPRTETTAQHVGSRL